MAKPKEMKIKVDAIMQKTMDKYGFDESVPLEELPNIITCRLDLSAYLFRINRKIKDNNFRVPIIQRGNKVIRPKGRGRR